MELAYLFCKEYLLKSAVLDNGSWWLFPWLPFEKEDETMDRSGRGGTKLIIASLMALDKTFNTFSPQFHTIFEKKMGWW